MASDRPNTDGHIGDSSTAATREMPRQTTHECAWIGSPQRAWVPHGPKDVSKGWLEPDRLVPVEDFERNAVSSSNVQSRPRVFHRPI
jgi:hypothetical protein